MCTNMLDMPHMPFEVYDSSYNKSVYVVSSCSPDTWKSVTLMFSEFDENIQKAVFEAINKSFDQPGVTRIQICRK